MALTGRAAPSRGEALLRSALPHRGASSACFRTMPLHPRAQSEIRYIQAMEFKEIINAVRTFHDAFGISNSDAPTAALSEADYLLRYKLMREENEEYLEACQQGDLVQIADALGDQLYILCGTLLKHGLHDKIEEVFREIQRSNMSKLDANGKPIYREDGKVLKSELYFPPNIAAILA
jgi:predicted HAD superfamily Cof-like phosphohydrolase